MTKTDTWQTRPLVREGAPQKDKIVTLRGGKKIYGQKSQIWARHQDILTDWPTVSRNVTLTLTNLLFFTALTVKRTVYWDVRGELDVSEDYIAPISRAVQLANNCCSFGLVFGSGDGGERFVRNVRMSLCPSFTKVTLWNRVIIQLFQSIKSLMALASTIVLGFGIHDLISVSRKKSLSFIESKRGHAVAYSLRHYARSRKVAGTRADEVNESFQFT
jgi:hypothetical protein